MTLEDLDRSSITLTVYDKKTFILSDSLLGSFTLDWTNVYFKRNHEIYRGWLMLSDPEDIVEGVMGYLLVDIAVLGPQDKVTVHDSAFIKDPVWVVVILADNYRRHSDNAQARTHRLRDFYLNLSGGKPRSAR